MEKAVSKIEETFKRFAASSINDFVVLSGVELFPIQKVVLLQRIKNWRELNEQAS